MGKATITLEVDEGDLNKARAYIAKHGGSLNELVSTFIASLAREEERQLPALDTTTSVLLAASMGDLSLIEATRKLGLPDAGYVFHLLAEKEFPLPSLPIDFVTNQLEQARPGLDECLVGPTRRISN